MIKVLIVDDSAFNRKILSEILKSVAEIEIIGTAYDGEDAIRQIAKQKPDLITLDLEMPKMDGFTFLRWLMNTTPIPVIVVSAKEADENVFKALELGAMDFIPKPSSYPSMKLKEIQGSLIEKVLAAKYAKLSTPKDKLVKPRVQPESKIHKVEVPTDFIIAIGASTGGPQAIQYILSNLSREFIIPIVIAQHMPAAFTPLFAERLNKSTHLTAKEAENEEIIKAHHAYICPGGKHTILEKKGPHVKLIYKEKTNSDKYIPSINYLFESISQIYANKSVATILTGMGDDGKEGILKIKENGGKVIAESPDSAIVFGMPREAIKTGKIDQILHLNKIPFYFSKLSEQFQKNGS
jgi:two-component system, chemotaxis family, protein-glutamate methylesterase/glutaminase